MIHWLSARSWEQVLLLPTPPTAIGGVYRVSDSHHIWVVEPVTEPDALLPFTLLRPSERMVPLFGLKAVPLCEIVLPITRMVEPATDWTAVVLLANWQLIRFITTPASNALTPTPLKDKSELRTVQMLFAFPCKPGWVFQICTLSSSATAKPEVVVMLTPLPVALSAAIVTSLIDKFTAAVAAT